MLLLGNVFALQGATLPHQGRVLISGKAFEGTGSFRFALVDTAGNLVWNHQGTTGEPTTDLTLDVKGGFYSIALGDPSMADLPASLFTNYAGLKLRIWFNDGTNGLQQLGTDQNLLVAPYALNIPQPSSSAVWSMSCPGISQHLRQRDELDCPRRLVDRIGRQARQRPNRSQFFDCSKNRGAAASHLHQRRNGFHSRFFGRERSRNLAQPLRLGRGSRTQPR